MVDLLKEVSSKFALNQENSLYHQSLVQYVRAAASREVLESMAEIEHTESWLLQSQRRAEEKKLHDPDDVYFLVREREVERINQGHAPKIQFLAEGLAIRNAANPNDLLVSHVDVYKQSLYRSSELQKGLALMDRNALTFLTDLNRNVEGALALLEKLAEYPELKHEDFLIYQSYFREYLANTNMVVIDALEESEQAAMLKANRERVAYEKKIRDPDDCYFDVRNREEELRAQGLPSKIGVLRGMRRVTTSDILSDSFVDESLGNRDSNTHEATKQPSEGSH